MIIIKLTISKLKDIFNWFMYISFSIFPIFLSLKLHIKKNSSTFQASNNFLCTYIIRIMSLPFYLNVYDKNIKQVGT